MRPVGRWVIYGGLEACAGLALIRQYVLVGSERDIRKLARACARPLTATYFRGNRRGRTIKLDGQGRTVRS